MFNSFQVLSQIGPWKSILNLKIGNAFVFCKGLMQKCTENALTFQNIEAVNNLKTWFLPGWIFNLMLFTNVTLKRIKAELNITMMKWLLCKLKGSFTLTAAMATERMDCIGPYGMYWTLRDAIAFAAGLHMNTSIRSNVTHSWWKKYLSFRCHCRSQCGQVLRISYLNHCMFKMHSKYEHG